MRPLFSHAVKRSVCLHSVLTCREHNNPVSRNMSLWLWAVLLSEAVTHRVFPGSAGGLSGISPQLTLFTCTSGSVTFESANEFQEKAKKEAKLTVNDLKQKHVSETRSKTENLRRIWKTFVTGFSGEFLPCQVNDWPENKCQLISCQLTNNTTSHFVGSLGVTWSMRKT